MAAARSGGRGHRPPASGHVDDAPRAAARAAARPPRASRFGFAFAAVGFGFGRHQLAAILTAAPMRSTPNTACSLQPDVRGVRLPAFSSKRASDDRGRRRASRPRWSRITTGAAALLETRRLQVPDRAGRALRRARTRSARRPRSRSPSAGRAPRRRRAQDQRVGRVAGGLDRRDRLADRASSVVGAGRLEAGGGDGVEDELVEAVVDREPQVGLDDRVDRRAARGRRSGPF